MKLEIDLSEDVISKLTNEAEFMIPFVSDKKVVVNIDVVTNCITEIVLSKDFLVEQIDPKSIIEMLIKKEEEYKDEAIIKTEK